MAVVLSASIRTKIALYLQKAVSLFPSLKSTEDVDLSANVGSNQGTLICGLPSRHVHSYNLETRVECCVPLTSIFSCMDSQELCGSVIHNPTPLGDWKFVILFYFIF